MKGYDGTIKYSLDDENSTNPENLETRCLYQCSTCLDVSEKIDNGHKDKERQSNTPISKDDESTVYSSKQMTKLLKGDFLTITGCVTSCISPKSPKGLSPSAHLGDGNLDLIVVSQTSRWNYLRYLIRTNMPSSSFSPFQLPFVQIHRVKEFSFQPDNENKTKEQSNSKTNSVWNCDGELITNPSIHAKVYCQILPLFARGIE